MTASVPIPDEPPAEWVEIAAARLRDTHWDGTGCGTNGPGGCSRCYGPSPADSREVTEDVLAELWPKITEREAAAARAEGAREALDEAIRRVEQRRGDRGIYPFGTDGGLELAHNVLAQLRSEQSR